MSVGSIEGYYIAATHNYNIYNDMTNRIHNSLTFDLYCFLQYGDLWFLTPNYFLLRFIVLDKKYDTPEMLVSCINHLPRALFELYQYEVRSVICRLGESEYKLAVDYEMDEVKYKREEKALLESGFRIFSEEPLEECPWPFLYKNYNFEDE